MLAINAMLGPKARRSADTLKRNVFPKCATSITDSRFAAARFLTAIRPRNRLIWPLFSKDFRSAENWPVTKFTNAFTKSVPTKGLKSSTSCSAMRMRKRDFEQKSMSSYSEKHLAETVEIAQQIDSAALEEMADLLQAVRERGGRLFFF